MLENQKLESFQWNFKLSKIANFCKDFPTASEPWKITLVAARQKIQKLVIFFKVRFWDFIGINFEVNVS